MPVPSTSMRARLGVDQELARGDDAVAFVQLFYDLDSVVKLGAGHDLDRLEPAFAERQHHGRARTGADQRVARNRQSFARGD